VQLWILKIHHLRKSLTNKKRRASACQWAWAQFAISHSANCEMAEREKLSNLGGWRRVDKDTCNWSSSFNNARENVKKKLNKIYLRLDIFKHKKQTVGRQDAADFFWICLSAEFPESRALFHSSSFFRKATHKMRFFDNFITMKI